MENKFPSEVIELPSQGFFYPESNSLSSGKIEIKYMTAKEEDILTSRNLVEKGTVIDVLLKSLILTDVNYDEILLGDKNAIMIASRVLAYGKDYNVEITCPSCREKSKITVDLTSFNTKEIDTTPFKKGSRIFSFVLPASNKTVELKLATTAEEKQIDGELKALKKISAQTGVDREMTTRLKHLIVSVDGDSSNETISKFIPSLLAKDSLELRKFIWKHTPDIDMTHFYECPVCSAISDVQIPITVDFFWPSGRE